ncbi:hypothetical protein [Rhizobium sp. L1K21]|uniref:hypothetical protein n=1 Tax=Rhizobium sp. L1K21 TaxID=2954933 RepID=UPI002092F9E5|nr:hypothetical protein [Rhizobium sp. L1K21]MCO6186478.1 hypothetical protein [Rhizobium sp. L1K21]
MQTASKNPRVWPELKADCSRCTGLCCVAYPFIDAGKFGYNKPANERCRHLGPDCRCSIHGERAEMGFKGCITFDCNGAGQRVANEIFQSVDWRHDAVAATEILDAFRALTHVHAALSQLKLLENLPFTDEQADRFFSLFAWLEPVSGWTEKSLESFPAIEAERAVQDFAASMKGTEAGRALAERLSGSSR